MDKKAGNLNAMDWIRKARSLPLQPIYVMVGDDPYLRREATRVLVDKALEGEDDDLALHRLEGKQADLASVLDELRTLPFFSKRRIVVIEEADPFVTRYRKDLESYFEKPTAAGILVLQVKTWPANTKLAKLLVKEGGTIACTSPSESELASWIPWLAKTHLSSSIDPDAVRLLIELVGAEPGLLASEVEKLSVYVGPERAIGSDDVSRMVGAGRVEKIWRALESATTGRGREAIELLDNLLTSGEHPIAALAAISSSLLKVHYAGRLRAARLSLEEACRQAGIYPGAIPLVQKQHAHLGPRRVDSIPALLLQVDFDLKGASALEPRVVLERLLLELAQPRRD